MNLEDLYNDIKFGTRTFNDKRLMRTVFPQIASGLARRSSANIGAAAQISSSLIGERGHVTSTGITQKGATHRENLRNAANEMLEKMRQGGQNTRLDKAISAKFGLESEGYKTDIAKMQERDRLATNYTRTFGDTIGKTSENDLEAVISKYWKPVSPVAPPQAARPWTDEDEAALEERWKKKDKKRDWSTEELLGL